MDAADNAVPGFAKRTRFAGQTSIKNALAARAGLNTFLPRPPQRPFTTTIANTLPATGTQYGTDAGSVKASKRPVTTEDKSFTVLRLYITIPITNSDATAARILRMVTIKARNPKSTHPTASVGISAMITSLMMFCVFLLPRI